MRKISNRKVNLMIILLVVSYLISCNECPPDKNIGDAFLSNESKEYMPYEEGFVSLSFVNSDGQIIELISEADKRYKIYNRVVAKPCSRELIDETNYTVSTEYADIHIYNDSIGVGLRIDLSILNNDTPHELVDTNWVETVEYSFSTNMINGYFGVSIITNDREKDYSISNIESYKFYDSIEIADEVFYQVYTNIDGEHFFFNKELGLVGFKYDTVEYKLSNL